MAYRHTEGHYTSDTVRSPLNIITAAQHQRSKTQAGTEYITWKPVGSQYVPVDRFVLPPGQSILPAGSTIRSGRASVVGNHLVAEVASPMRRRTTRTSVLSHNGNEDFAFVAIRNGCDEDLDAALLSGLDPNAVDSRKYSLLMWACDLGREEAVRMLLARGANADFSPVGMPTPLVLAAKKGYTSLCALLCQNNGNPSLTDGLKHSPLMYAAANGFCETAQVLLDFGAKINHVDTADFNVKALFQRSNSLSLWNEQSEGKTALHCAARCGHVSMIHLLCQAGANKNAKDDKGKTPLMWATVRGHAEVVGALLHEGASTEVSADDGATPLMWAARLGKYHIANLLLDFGANVNHARGDSSPLIWALQYSDQSMVSLLQRRGAVSIESAKIECCTAPVVFGILPIPCCFFMC